MPKRFATDSDEDNERPLSDEEDELGPVNGKWPFDGFGRSYDVPVPSGTSCTKISNILARAQATAGEYTLGGVADTLLALPGLVVDGVGQIPVPLTETCAKKLIDKSARSSFGHNFDTKMDENVRKSWQIEPDRVQLSNALWQSGIDKLTQTIAERLGYRSVPMQCTLYKMLVYGEGGHFLKHQDTEKEDGMVATLVIQLPSTHEGGDLVIYRGGEATYRHDFGKEDGMAAFLPHYAVHYADAEHSLEEVTKGYRLALVYSLCLPLTMRHLKRNNDKLLTEELAEALSTMGPEEESFALLLLHEYTEKSIEDLGSGALKGIDRARFVALEEANAAVPADRKMQFFIARLKHEIKYYGENGYEMSWWEESSRNHTITWFSTSGRRFGAENSTMKMNFLNPGHETFYELWRPHGSSKEKGFMGNHGPSKKTMYSRYAIIAWPAAQGVKNALEFINAEAAVSVLRTQKPIDTGAVGDILIKLQAELEKKTPDAKKTNAKPISAEFFQALCEILVDVGDVAFLNEFFLKCFAKLCTRLQDKDAVVPVLTTMFRSLNRNDIGRAVLESFGQLDNRTSLEIGLLVANGLDDGEAKTALMHYGMEKAVQLSDGMASCSTKPAEVLWKSVLGSDDLDALTTFAEKVTKSQPSSLAVASRVLVECLGQIDTKGAKFAALAAIVEKRITWLKAQIQLLDKPFSWEMPDAEVSDNAQVQTFLRGTAQSMVTKDAHRFKKLQDAHNFAAKWMRAEQKSASYVMTASEEDGTAVVTIAKTRAWFSARQKELLQYTTELEMLTTHLGEGAQASGDM